MRVFLKNGESTSKFTVSAFISVPLNFFWATEKTVHDMHVEVRIAVARPDELDVGAIAAEIPYGTVTVTPVQGGLDVEAPEGSLPAGVERDGIAIANAAILVSFEE